MCVVLKEDMQVHLIEGSDRVLPPMSPQASEKAHRFLTGLGVHVHLNTFVADYDGQTVVTKEGSRLDTATFIWAAGVTGAPVAGIDGKALVGKANRYRVNSFNQIEGFANVFALGDVAQMELENFLTPLEPNFENNDTH